MGRVVFVVIVLVFVLFYYQFWGVEVLLMIIFEGLVMDQMFFLLDGFVVELLFSVVVLGNLMFNDVVNCVVNWYFFICEVIGKLFVQNE